MAPNHQFHFGDYAVFSATIIVSVAIGIFYAFSGSKQRTTKEYLVGSHTMSFFPVAVSLLVSFESSIMILGIPAEGYVYGLQWIWGPAGFFVSQILSVYIIVPLLYPLKLTSAYEYLEYRFKSKAVRRLGTCLGMVTSMWYMGIVLFGPSVALEAVTGFSQWSSIFIIAFVAVVYTSIGGLKAVVWTDVFQAFVMFMGVFAILIKGTMDAGGAKNVWDVAERAGRMNFFNFSLDPRVRHTFWNLFVGSVIRGFGFCFSQSTIQRISATRSIIEARRMLLLVAPAFLLTLALACYEGVVIYSYYSGLHCDPLASRQIRNPNQLVPLAVMDMFRHLPGMPGLFLASLFSASLSTLSSGLSSMAAIFWADIVHPIVGDIADWKATIIAKVSVVIFGFLSCGIAVSVSEIGGTLTEISGSLVSAFGGPLTGMFFLASFWPRCNAAGLLIGGSISVVFSAWIAMGMSFSKSVKHTPWLPFSPTDGCFNLTQEWNFTDSTTATVLASTSQKPAITGPQGVETLYTLSYQWLPVLGIVGTILLGLITSFLTGMNKPGDVDPRYILSLTETFLFFLPKWFRDKISSIGPQFKDDRFLEKFPQRMSAFDVELNISTVSTKQNDLVIANGTADLSEAEDTSNVQGTRL